VHALVALLNELTGEFPREKPLTVFPK